MWVQILPDIDEACIFLSAVIMAVGWYFIRRGRVEVHKRLMLTGSVLAVLFFLLYVARTIFIGDATFDGPQNWHAAYYTFLQAHSILATVAAVLGIITLTFAFRRNFRRHRKIGPWTVVIWFVTAATGTMVYLLLYVIYPSGNTTSLLHAWLGH
ncbi:DUF420 domain-containing protein [Alicyclobacillus cycloheptanicus]|uniref:Membrane protein n=1 Tax=Alicyclobacillus cycloheptanicus TaxID=1457 RepID=A0ABT9XH27_9BACL|nr:DUF420 domain-containing protein [Alicyclobacillus cycloheptanicus]MDQ0189609.1 putative membrane protein [Alicyclobacillus cycloheptanicus]WDL99918.1 DUF420 domain-containing protein [Alicyclobacillus cycloheptanicus]